MLRPHEARASWGDAISGVLDVDHDRSREWVLGPRRASGDDHERAGGDLGARPDTTDITDHDERDVTRCAHADDERGALPAPGRARSR